MKLLLKGHNYKYAVEQIMLALFPEERPDYLDNDSKNDIKLESAKDKNAVSAESRLTQGGAYAQATTVIRKAGGEYRGAARVSGSRLTGKLITDRLLQYIIKQSFYRAAMGVVSPPPVWGSLTGIRPAKIAETAIISGARDASAIKMLTSRYYVSPERAAMCVDAAKSALSLKKGVMPRDIAVYVGVPFCPTRCAYCSFVSNSVENSFALIEPFAETLLREISMAAGTARDLGLRVIAVYIGGGTPTALPPGILQGILAELKRSFDFSAVREYTVEAGRPDTVTVEKLDIIKDTGAERICVNPQSMSDGVLSAIGRKHTAVDVEKAAGLARSRGFALNMDLIAGLPSDTPSGFGSSIDAVLEMKPENITVHTLSLKKGSRIMRESTAIPDSGDVSAMLGYANGRLRENGYSPYYLYRQKFISGGFENVGWSLPGYEGVYNMCMMEELCTVLALGGGGVTKLVAPDGRIGRLFNAKYPREYIGQTEKMTDKFRRIREMYRSDA